MVAMFHVYLVGGFKMFFMVVHVFLKDFSSLVSCWPYLLKIPGLAVSLPGRSFPTWSSPDSHVLVAWERYPIGSMHGIGILWYINQQLADFYDTFWQTYTMHGYAWILFAWSNK